MQTLNHKYIDKKELVAFMQDYKIAENENRTEDAYIKLATYSQTNKEILEISDYACGIAEDIIERIFNLYFSTKLDKNGTGLDFYMSKTIVEDHCGGELSAAKSEDGAIFKVVSNV